MLRRAITAVALALASAGVAAAHAQAQSPAKLDPRFVAFRDDCVAALHNLAEAQKRVTAAGWTKVDPASQPELKKVYDNERKMSSYPGVTFDTYSRTVGGRALYMLIKGNLARYEISEPARKNECAVYDFEDEAFAADPDADHIVERWLGVPPSKGISNPNVQVSNKDWDSFTYHHPDLERVHVQSIAAGENTRYWTFSGRMWSAQAAARQ